MWIVHQGIYGQDFESKKTYICKTDEDLSAAYKRFEQDLLEFGTNVEEKILEVKSFEYMLKNFSIGKLKMEFPEIEKFLNKFMKDCDKAVVR